MMDGWTSLCFPLNFLMFFFVLCSSEQCPERHLLLRFSEKSAPDPACATSAVVLFKEVSRVTHLFYHTMNDLPAITLNSPFQLMIQSHRMNSVLFWFSITPLHLQGNYYFITAIILSSSINKTTDICKYSYKTITCSEPYVELIFHMNTNLMLKHVHLRHTEQTADTHRQSCTALSVSQS